MKTSPPCSSKGIDTVRAIIGAIDHDQQTQVWVVLEYVTDIKATARFYTDVLGLKVERSHPTYVQFSNFAIASDEAVGGSRERELYWSVEDAQAAFEELAQQAEVSLPLTQKPFGTVFGIKDPSGRRSTCWSGHGSGPARRRERSEASGKRGSSRKP